MVAAYELMDHQLATLRLALEALDRAQEAKKLLEEDGLTFKDRFGQVKANPAAAMLRDAENAYRLLMRELNLEPEPADNRPPHVPGRF